MNATMSETRVDTLDEGISAVSQRLLEFEKQHGRTSEEFYNTYEQGSVAPSRDFEAWASDYELYLHLVIRSAAIRRAQQSNEGVSWETPSFSSNDLLLADLAA